MRLGLLSPLALSALAGAYTLSGTLVVSGSSLPLSGATVRLAQRSDIPSAVSDAKGAFLLTDQTTGVASSPSAAFALRQSGGELIATGLMNGHVTLELFTLDGRLLSRQSAPVVAGQAHLKSSGTGLRIARLRQGTMQCRWVLSGLEGAGGSHTPADLASGVAARTAGQDSLIVTRDGMDTLHLALPEGAGTTLTTMAAPVALQARISGRQRFVPGGTVLMGDTTLPNARPRIHRTVAAFWMDTLLATRAELKALGFPQNANDNHPADLNWDAAVRYCNARSAQEDLTPAYRLTVDSAYWSAEEGASGYRLPTEAEWELAARAGSETPWFWGTATDTATISKYALFTGNSRGDQVAVGTFKPNPLGFYDIVGNAGEWTEDWYGPYLADETQPVAIRNASIDPQSQVERVWRGGSWFARVDSLRSGARSHCGVIGSAYVGVRCVRTAQPVTPPRPWAAFAVSGSMRRIPGGTFVMGDSLQAEALPLNRRTVATLWVDTATVTQADFKKLTGISGYGDSLLSPDINWYKAVRYCNARSLKDGLEATYTLTGDSTTWNADTSKNGYRLPSEAEWEYLARAGSTSPWWWGNDTSVNAMASRVWWYGNAVGNPQHSGLKHPNAFGLYDMTGNYQQWTGDLYGAYRADGGQPIPASQTYGYHRVYRGGGWFSPASDLRCGRRSHDMGLASGYISFRCVRKAE